ncbi:MAG: DNA repair protein RadC [Candidatus Omnitrophica bacterium]|jgi:DNA repair protein RadC|nr:DNA repair protein RadC [Candidatus Omnitrophota bacterium]
MNKTGIKLWPKEDRPREKLFRFGEHSLSNAELVAILLGSGVRGQSALDLAREIIFVFGNLGKMAHTDIRRWREIKGLGDAKIAQIKAALEIGRRFGEEKVKETRPKIKSSQDAADILMPRMRDLQKEVFKVLLLNSQNRVIDIVETEEGTVNQAHPIIREIFQQAMQYFAAAIICLHNHPSGDPRPSQEDKEFTQQLAVAGTVLQIKTLDHIIIGNNKYFSFADKGLI